jgi:hypothetical protein
VAEIKEKGKLLERKLNSYFGGFENIFYFKKRDDIAIVKKIFKMNKDRKIEALYLAIVKDGDLRLKPLISSSNSLFKDCLSVKRIKEMEK